MHSSSFVASAFADIICVTDSAKELDKQELAAVDSVGDVKLVIAEGELVHDALEDEEAAICCAAIMCWPKENMETRLVI